MSNGVLIVMVPLQPLQGLPNVIAHPLTPSQLTMAYSGLKEQLLPFFREDMIPVSPVEPPGPGRIDSFHVGGSLNGMILGKHEPIPQETRLEELGDGPNGFRRAEIQRMAHNAVLSKYYYDRAYPVAGDSDALITVDRQWHWLTHLRPSETYERKYWELRETAGQEQAFRDHLFQHPRETFLRGELEKLDSVLLVVVGVHLLGSNDDSLPVRR